VGWDSVDVKTTTAGVVELKALNLIALTGSGQKKASPPLLEKYEDARVGVDDAKYVPDEYPPIS
jgi:hypothetical protein